MAVSTPDSKPWRVRLHEQADTTAGRTSYDIDRDRIVHCESFRELQDKTQVQSIIGSGSSPGFRTRLNHVIEVAQLGRSLARSVGGNEALTEAIALAHDLGHPPFGHAGERALDSALKRQGLPGWNANLHSLEVVDEIEVGFLGFRGLDLTWATREGIARHSTPFDAPAVTGEFADSPQSGLECQIVDAADLLAYIAHDLDDALANGFVQTSQLTPISSVLAELVSSAQREWVERGQRVWPEADRDTLVRKAVVARLINICMVDLVGQTQSRIEAAGLDAPAAVRNAAERAVGLSPRHAEATLGLLDLLVDRYYRSQSVGNADRFAGETLTGIFSALMLNPARIPARFQRGSSALSVATYVASLNDRSALNLSVELGVASSSSSDPTAVNIGPDQARLESARPRRQ